MVKVNGAALLRRWMLLGLIGFGSLVSFIRAQPYIPLVTEGLPGPAPGCETPCFMGIQVGKTSGTEALTILSQHPWVDTVERPLDQFFVWSWTGQQPTYIDSRQPGIITVNADRVILISMMTTVNLGDWVLQWGTPSVMESGSAVGNSLLILYSSLGYAEPGVYLGNNVRPCHGVDSLWRQPPTMEVRTVYPPWNTRTLDEFIQRFQLLRERNCRR
jgi:hypothetical protein